MKKLKIILVSLMCSLLPVGVAAAVADSNNSVDDGTVKTQEAEVEEEKTEIETEQEKNESRKKRLDEAKAKARAALDAATKTRIENRCEAAQVLVTNVKARADERSKVRDGAYEKLSEKIANLITRLGEKNVDTTTIEQQKAQLDLKISQFKADLSTYRQTLADLALMDCKADPTGFKSLLLEARTEREAVIADAAAIKDYVQTTIKPTLVQIREALEAGEE